MTNEPQLRESAPLETPRPATPAIFYMLSALLIGLFAYRLLVPVHVMPSPTERNLTILFDIMMVAGLFGLKRRAADAQALFWIAAAAGVGLLALRLTGNTGFWSGHLRFTFLPR